MTEFKGIMTRAKEWAKKSQQLFPDNELFPAMLEEEDEQPEVESFAKLGAYHKMLEAKYRRLSGQPLVP